RWSNRQASELRHGNGDVIALGFDLDHAHPRLVSGRFGADLVAAPIDRNGHTERGAADDQTSAPDGEPGERQRARVHVDRHAGQSAGEPAGFLDRVLLALAAALAPSARRRFVVLRPRARELALTLVAMREQD